MCLLCSKAVIPTSGVFMLYTSSPCYRFTRLMAIWFSLWFMASTTNVVSMAQRGKASREKSQANDATMNRFVDDLLAKMTLEEKVGQMSQIAYNEPPDVPFEESIRKEQTGSLLFVLSAKDMNRLQHIAVEETRLHIPLIFGFDVVHGFRTIYPVPLAMAASWDPAAVQQAQHMAAREASSIGIRWTFAPMVDIARDARWGRMMEGAGEDPYLGARIAEGQIRGFQGENLSDPDSILACVKHFAGYGTVEGGRDYESANISDEQLWNVILPPFHAALRAGAGSFMSAYMDFNGVPATGNHYLLHDVLRDDWKFDGMVVSDWESVVNLTTHGFSSGPEDAAARSVNAGVDMEMTSHTYRDTLVDAVKKGLVKQARIDEAVRNILVAKYRLGLFQHPYVAAERGEQELVSTAQRDAARKAAERTAVLLRNEGATLPLKD